MAANHSLAFRHPVGATSIQLLCQCFFFSHFVFSRHSDLLLLKSTLKWRSPGLQLPKSATWTPHLEGWVHRWLASATSATHATWTPSCSVCATAPAWPSTSTTTCTWRTSTGPTSSATKGRWRRSLVWSWRRCGPACTSSSARGTSRSPLARSMSSFPVTTSRTRRSCCSSSWTAYTRTSTR